MIEKERIILLSKLDREKVIIETESEFNDSIFNLVYQKAEVLLQNIIKENQSNNDICSGKTIKREPENIISFEGRRGTGKSSAMRSVQEALKNYSNNNFLKNPENNRCNTDYYFHVIEAIDASTIEEKENFLEVVLAGMFVDLRTKVQEREILEKNDYASRELYRLFGEVFEILMNLYGTKKDYYYKDDSPLHALSQMSNSRMLSDKIQEIVKKYLRYMSPSDRSANCDKNNFLVIAVDDLDMHFKPNGYNSYQLLESIHRYLMIPNVIVLVSYSYLDLCAACEKHFENLYPQPESILETRPKVQKLAVEYLDKVCPIYSRIHMPSLRKKDYQEKKNVKIIITKKEGQKILNDFVKMLWDEDDTPEETIKLPVKKFIFLLKASLAGLYYDANGQKKHFAESDNLRSLSQTYTFFVQLKKIQTLKNGGTQAVFKELLDDLYFRFAGEKLTRNDYEKFRGFLDVNIERRSRDILDDLRQKIEIRKQDNSDEYWKGTTEITYRGHNNKRSYSYGELLYFLYHASKERLYCKELIWCILDSYTITLTKLYRQLVYLDDKSKVNADNIDSDDKEERLKIRKKISSIIGTSVASSWSNVYMPSLQLKNLNYENDKFTVFLDNQDGAIERAAAIKGNWVKGKWIYELWYDADEKVPLDMKESVKENLQLLEILCMFITGVFEKSEDEDTEISKFEYQAGILNPDFNYTNLQKGRLEYPDSQKNKSDKVGPSIILYFNEICFNILNFINNLFEGEDFFDNLHKKLIPGYKKYFMDLQRARVLFHDEEITDQFVKDFFENNSLKQDVIKWSKYTHGFALPLYSFDMMYNIFKRMYLRQGILPPSVQKENYWDYVKKVYNDLGELLKEEDNFYFTGQNNKKNEVTEKNKETSHDFYYKYTRSPFIKFITELEEDNERSRRKKEKFAEAFIDMIRTMANLF